MKMRTGGEREALYISHFIIINVVEFRSRDANSSSRANNNRNTRTWHRFPLPRIFVPPNDRHFLLASLALARKKEKKSPRILAKNCHERGLILALSFRKRKQRCVWPASDSKIDHPVEAEALRFLYENFRSKATWQRRQETMTTPTILTFSLHRIVIYMVRQIDRFGTTSPIYTIE